LLNRHLLSIFLWCYGSLVVIAVVLFLFLEPDKWNHPVPTFQTQSGIFNSGNKNFSYSLSCNCPFYLIEGGSTDLTFTLELTPKNPQTASKSAATTATPVPAAATEIEVDASAAKVEVVNNNFEDPNLIAAGAQASIPFKVHLDGVKADLTQVNIRLAVTPAGNSVPYTFQSWMWPFETRPPFSRWVLKYAGAALVILILGLGAFWLNRRLRLQKQEAEQKISAASSLAKAHPDVAKFAWDVAQANLQAYFDRNLIQVNLVFWVACVVMAVGFSFVLAGVWLAYTKTGSIGSQLVAAVSGIITQFIGATFMVIYRSTMAQANEFMTVLERINSVGMAVQILDALKDGTDLKDKTRAELATLLLVSRTGLHNKTNFKGQDAREVK
jgi:hypothetical protein